MFGAQRLEGTRDLGIKVSYSQRGHRDHLLLGASKLHALRLWMICTSFEEYPVLSTFLASEVEL
jgi:hypothetical protein